jgi:hypothetical protein
MLDRLIERSRRTVLECQLSRVETIRRRDRMVTARRVRRALADPDGTASMQVPTGTRGDLICAIDGDGTTMCRDAGQVTPVIGYEWRDIPIEQRCPLCQVVLYEFR